MTQDEMAVEICKREKRKGRDLNITEVRAVQRHLLEILSEMKPADRMVFIESRMDYYQKKRGKK